jgi:hypothetical protein
LLLQYFDRIVTDQAHIAEASCFGLQEAMPDSGSVYFDAQVVEFRVPCRLLDKGLSVAKADLENAFGGPAECPLKVQRNGRKLEPIPRPEVMEGSLLRRSNAPCPTHEASHPAVGAWLARIAGLVAQWGFLNAWDCKLRRAVGDGLRADTRLHDRATLVVVQTPQTSVYIAEMSPRLSRERPRANEAFVAFWQKPIPICL